MARTKISNLHNHRLYICDVDCVNFYSVGILTKGKEMGEDILIRFDSLTVGEEGQKIISENRAAFKVLAKQLDDNLPSGRLKALVLTKLEEAAMFATKFISHG